MDAFKKQILLESGLLIGVLIISLILIQVLIPRLERTSLAVQEKRADLSFISLATGLLPQLKEEFAKAQPLTSELNRVLPPKMPFTDLNAELNSLAKKAKISASFSMVRELPKSESIPGSVQFLITSDATYGSFVKFLKEIEQSRLFIKINSLNFNKQASGDRYNIVANAEVFYQ